MLVGTNKDHPVSSQNKDHPVSSEPRRGHVVGFCIHARVHTGLRAHVTLFHGKRVEECSNSDSARPSETSTPGGP